MNRKKALVTASLVVAALAAAIILFLFFNPAGERASGIPGIIHAITGGMSFRSTPGASSPGDPFSDRMVGDLVKYYGKTIAEKSTQAALIGIRDLIIGLHPENGRAYFYSILKRAFPQYADEIMDTLDRLDRYTAWLEQNREMLMNMTASERLAAMRKKREELFGKDAEKIWSGELLATEERKAKVKDTLADLNGSKETTIDEKLEIFRGALQEAYGSTPESFVLDQKGMLAKVFFSIDSVQEELKMMTPEQRQQEINRIRRNMGFTEEQIERMAQKDAYYAKRWDNGLKYMQDRDKIVQEFEGQEQEEKLQELREQYFKNEAGTIALEEKDGFFRFQRPHIYGRN